MHTMPDDIIYHTLPMWPSVDRLVKGPQQPDDAKEQPTTDGSGPTPSASSTKSSRKSASSRTYPVLGRSMRGVPLEKSSGLLPKEGTMLGGDIYALPMLE